MQWFINAQITLTALNQFETWRQRIRLILILSAILRVCYLRVKRDFFFKKETWANVWENNVSQYVLVKVSSVRQHDTKKNKFGIINFMWSSKNIRNVYGWDEGGEKWDLLVEGDGGTEKKLWLYKPNDLRQNSISELFHPFFYNNYQPITIQYPLW